jgi:hypothetical protein
MNEIQLLRDQLAAERRHVREVASACAAAYRAEPAPAGGAALVALAGACRDYLECVLVWFDRRDARLGELCARLPAGGADGEARGALDLSGHGRDALDRLRAAGPAHEDWAALALFVNGAWDTRRSAIEALLASRLRVTDWRAVSGIDADTIYEERALYSRVRAALPAGVELTPWPA